MSKRLFKTMVAVLAIAAAAAGPVRGQNSSTSTLTFTGAYGTYGATANDEVEWTVTSDGTESNFDDTKGIHYGTGSAQVQYIQLSTSDIIGTITQVVVNASTASGVSATVGVTVGGNAFGGNAQSLSTDATDYTFTGSATGAIVVRVAKPSAATKALYVKSIVVTYTPASAAPAVPHTVRFAEGMSGWQVTDVRAEGSTSATYPTVLENVMAGDSLVVTAPNELTRKVKSVKAVKYVAPVEPVAGLQTLTVAKGSSGLSGNKVLYYMSGDTYRQALAREENQSTDGLGWGMWESAGLTTIYFKEVSNKAWDMAIDGDSNFSSGQGSSTITLDTVIDPTNHTFQFVDSQ